MSSPVAGVPASKLSGPEPAGPEVLPLLAIHRHDDGVVTFHRKGSQAGTFENLFGIRPRDLPNLFPQFAKELDRDSYFSINAFWHPEQKKQMLPATEARQPNRLRYLCAAYSDIDIHHLQVDFGTALAAIVRLQDEKYIPPSSAIVRSGRGLWLLWFLHDARDPQLPLRAFPEKLRNYLHVNRAIHSRLASIGADASARDALRLTRVPGSVHPLSNNRLRVKYWLQGDCNGKPYSYTLGELAQLFGVASEDLVPEERKAMLEAERPTGRRYRGYASLHARRLREFSVLRAMRGGFAQGCRNCAVLVYSWLLRCNRTPPERILREALILAKECRPPLSDGETRQAVKTVMGWKLARFRDQMISDWLKVTPAESACLEKMPASVQFGVKGVTQAKESRKAERRAAIRQILQDLGSVPSCRSMARMLRERQIAVSHMQVSRDYKTVLAELRLEP